MPESNRDPAMVQSRVGILETILLYLKEAAIGKVHACTPVIIPRFKIPAAMVLKHVLI